MHAALYILALMSLASSAVAFGMAADGLHQVVAGLFAVIAAVLFAGGAVVQAIAELAGRPADQGTHGRTPAPDTPHEAAITTETLDRLVASGRLSARK